MLFLVLFSSNRQLVAKRRGRRGLSDYFGYQARRRSRDGVSGPEQLLGSSLDTRAHILTKIRLRWVGSKQEAEERLDRDAPRPYTTSPLGL